MTQNTFILSLYTEMTPNPASLKFVMNKVLLPGNSVDFKEGDDLSGSPLADHLFKLPYVKGVFIANNFVTISKSPDYEWFEIKSEISEFLKKYIGTGGEIVNQLPEQKSPEQPVTGDETDIDTRIRMMLDQYVKPAVEMDGGAIQFKSFENGVVTVYLQGSCSGCPSATVTLKSGIESLLKRMIPEVEEVVAESV